MYYASYEIITNTKPREHKNLPVRDGMTIADVIAELGITDYTMPYDGNLNADVSLGYDVKERVLDRNNYDAYGDGIRHIEIMPKVLWSDGCIRSVSMGGWDCCKNNTTIECALN